MTSATEHVRLALERAYAALDEVHEALARLEEQEEWRQEPQGNSALSGVIAYLRKVCITPSQNLTT